MIIDFIATLLTGLFLNYWLNHLRFHPNLHICIARASKRRWHIVSGYNHKGLNCTASVDSFGWRLRTQVARCLGCREHLVPEELLIKKDTGWPLRMLLRATINCRTVAAVRTVLMSMDRTSTLLYQQARHRKNIRLHIYKWYFWARLNLTDRLTWEE